MEVVARGEYDVVYGGGFVEEGEVEAASEAAEEEVERGGEDEGGSNDDYCYGSRRRRSRKFVRFGRRGRAAALLSTLWW